MIIPTPGRVVWFRPAEHDDLLKNLGDRRLAAIVVAVHDDRCVNLSVHDLEGHVCSRIYVPLLQDDDEGDPGLGWAEWMPYQVGQARNLDEEAIRRIVRDELGTKSTDAVAKADVLWVGQGSPAYPQWTKS